ncbi:MAG: NYN domain-containing protein [Acidimicrobiaceae bacterium]|nr:NYN domain-containing protein [Acidimicrobiaceae bacterium]
MIVVDAMNVIGSKPDGWWKDRGGALARLVDALVAFDFDQWVVVVADGRPVPGLPSGTRGNVELRYAGRSDPDAADDEIIALLAELNCGESDSREDQPVTVVSSDRALISRAEQLGARCEGARSFRRRLGW